MQNQSHVKPPLPQGDGFPTAQNFHARDLVTLLQPLLNLAGEEF